jgi:hypothetical protein
MAATLITVAQAKAHLKRPDLADDDPDLLQKMDAAEASILTYVRKEAYGRTVSADWLDPVTVPADVQHAILIQLRLFDRYRGDDDASSEPLEDDDVKMKRAITALLACYASPVIG